MIEVEQVAVVLLAAGLSKRFGNRDKLAEPLGDLALGLHAARTLHRLNFAARIVATRAGGLDFAAYGFTPIINAEPERGQSASIRLGVARARSHRPAAILIALADMPFITIPHLHAMLDCFEGDPPVVASTRNGQPSPPALFDASLFDALEACEGDVGARALLRHAALIAAPPVDLVDIDTRADISRFAALISEPVDEYPTRNRLS